MSSMIASAEAELLEGTLEDGRLFVAPSRLGEASGLGLFAGVSFRRGDFMTIYAGPMLHREQLPTGFDTSYLLRVPNAGDSLIDGKMIAEAIRGNGENPAPNGRYYPPEGAREWRMGVASMANDPHDKSMYNAHISFKKPDGGNIKFKQPLGSNRALNELVPMIGVLYATRDINEGDEIYYAYGSEKPFEHFRKEMQEREKKERHKQELRNVWKLLWVPFDSKQPKS